MNKHPLDRLFEEKLEPVQQEPSDKAKARFDQLLAQKHKKPVLIWWQVAAAVLLLGVSTVAYLNWPAGQEQPLTADLPEKAPQLAESTSEDAKNAGEFDSGASNNNINASENDITAIGNDKNALENRSIALENDKNADENGKTALNSPTIASDPSTAIAVAEESDAVDTDADQDTQPLQTGLDAMADDNIAVADNNENEPEVISTNEAENRATIDPLDLATEVAVATNEPVAEEAPKKKRMPVTIIYKSSNADQSLVAMQDIRDDVDTLSAESGNSLKSILQNAGNGSLLAEFKKAKEDLFNLDIPLKTKKVEN
ncbi:MAG: hypothetical protein RIC80_01485 [Cyclobacteriaceae bacterium]